MYFLNRLIKSFACVIWKYSKFLCSQFPAVMHDLYYKSLREQYFSALFESLNFNRPTACVAWGTMWPRFSFTEILKLKVSNYKSNNCTNLLGQTYLEWCFPNGLLCICHDLNGTVRAKIPTHDLKICCRNG